MIPLFIYWSTEIVFYLLFQTQAANLLQDDRFNKIFKDPNFQIDPESIEYRLLNPVVSKLDKEKKKREKAMEANFTEVQVSLVSGTLEQIRTTQGQFCNLRELR